MLNHFDIGFIDGLLFLGFDFWKWAVRVSLDQATLVVFTSYSLEGEDVRYI